MLTRAAVCRGYATQANSRWLSPWVKRGFATCGTPRRLGKSLESENHEGIDLGGATRWQIAGQQRGGQQHQGRAEENQRVYGPHAKQQAPEQASLGQRTQESKDQARECKPHSLAHHQLQNISRIRAQGHADAHLLFAHGHRIRHHAVHADRREQKSE